MLKILLVSILLFLVYQFDEVVRTVRAIYSKLRKRKYKQLILESDRYVGTALAIIGMPMALTFLLSSERELISDLIIIFVMFLTFFLLASGLGIFLKRLKHLEYYHGVNSLVGTVYTFAGLFHPVARAVPWHSGKDRMVLAKLALLLSLPVLFGIFTKTYYGPTLYSAEFDKHMNVLIVVMIGALFINFTTKVLEKYLKRSRIGLWGFVRILAGVAVTSVLFLR